MSSSPRAQLSWAQSGFKFFYSAFVDPDTHQPVYWDPVNGNFSAIPFIYGTLVSSFLSLLFAVPLAIGVAVFLTEMCPGIFRGPLAFLTELLAAIPSIIYGTVGRLRPCPADAPVCEPRPGESAWLDRSLY
ncbi:MAG: hypothetical protein WDM87_13465 [Terracidiphilus sp.]